MEATEIKQKFFDAALSLGRCNIGNTVLVSGSPRSGTTWLAEIFRELPGYKMLDEPLFPGTSVIQEVDIIAPRTHLRAEDEVPDVEKAFLRILTGQVGGSWKWDLQRNTRVGKLFEVATSRKLVVKTVRSSRLLPWLSRQFKVGAVVSLFRHPCAVVASQMSGSWHDEKAPTGGDLSVYRDDIPEPLRQRFEHVLRSVETTAGKLAAEWAMDTYVPLAGEMGENWFVLTYEGLLAHPEEEISRVTDHLGQKVGENVRKQFSTVSATTRDEEDPTIVEKQLRKWRQQLSSTQIEAILTVVEAFGLDFYTDQVQPDYKHLEEQIDRAHRERRIDLSLS